jgi:hypothetical protein
VEEDLDGILIDIRLLKDEVLSVPTEDSIRYTSSPIKKDGRGYSLVSIVLLPLRIS